MASLIKEDPKDPDLEIYKVRKELKLSNIGSMLQINNVFFLPLNSKFEVKGEGILYGLLECIFPKDIGT